MFDEIQRVLVEKNSECPNCSEQLYNGSIMYRDIYRDEYFCPCCEKDYKEEVIREEGEHGEKLK